MEIPEYNTVFIDYNLNYYNEYYVMWLDEKSKEFDLISLCNKSLKSQGLSCLDFQMILNKIDIKFLNYFKLNQIEWDAYIAVNNHPMTKCRLIEHYNRGNY